METDCLSEHKKRGLFPTRITVDLKPDFEVDNLRTSGLDGEFSMISRFWSSDSALAAPWNRLGVFQTYQGVDPSPRDSESVGLSGAHESIFSKRSPGGFMVPLRSTISILLKGSKFPGFYD